MNIYDTLLSRCICNGDKDDRIELTVTENGIYEAPPGKVFSRVLVNTPIGGGGMIVRSSVVGGSIVMDKTFKEIYDALASGTPCYYAWNDYSGDDIDGEYSIRARVAPIVNAYKYNTTYRVFVADAYNYFYSSLSTTLGVPAVLVFQVSSASDYPIFLKKVYVNYSSTTTDNYVD